MRDRLGRGVVPSHLHQDRVAQERIGENADFPGKRGGEQQVLALLGQKRHDAAHVGNESHVEHAVGFVEHEGLDLLQVDRLLLHVVEQPPGGGHQELDALAQRRGLRLHIDAAEHHGAAQAGVLAVDAHALFDLRGELAGGREDQGPHRMARGRRARVGVAREALQERQREARRLAGSGLGAAHDVASLQDQRDRLRLDRRGLGVALLSDCFQQLGD